MRNPRFIRAAPIVALFSLVKQVAAAAPTADPPFAAPGYDASAIDEIWSGILTPEAESANDYS